jgi:hypothetical protein
VAGGQWPVVSGEFWKGQLFLEGESLRGKKLEIFGNGELFHNTYSRFLGVS